jgi:hypothetical protein
MSRTCFPSIISLIFPLMHTQYIHFKNTKIHIKTLNTCPYIFRSLFKTILRWLVDCTLLSCSFRLCVCLVFLAEWNLVMEFHGTTHTHTHTHTQTHTYTHTYTHKQTEWTDIRPQTAQLYNQRISTDPILVTWQSTVYEPTEEGFKKKPKHVGGKC